MVEAKVIMKRALCFIIVLLNGLSAHSQCADFIVDNTACINQSIQFQNLSSGISFEWDFCPGDLLTTPTATNVGTIAGVSENRGIEIIYDGSNWFGFATGRTSNALVRLDFGDDFQNSPTQVNLGNVGGLLDGPEPIKIIKEDGLWYGLVHNGVSKTLVRLNFGSTLSNTPTAELAVSNIGGLSSKFDLVYTNDSLVLVMVNFTSPSTMSFVNFNNSITNNPLPPDFFTTPNLTSSWTTSISMIQECDNWYGVSENLFSGKAYLFSFGISPFSEPTVQEIGSSIYGSDDPTSSWVEKDDGGYIIHSVMTNGNLYKVNLGSDLSVPTAITNNLGTLSALSKTYSLCIVNHESKVAAFSTDRVSGKLVRLDFLNSCVFSEQFSTDFEPSGLEYPLDGTFQIGLTSRDINGQILDKHFEIINVNNSIAPSIDFQNLTSCISNGIDFVPSDETLTSYLWDFGDTNTASVSNPSHTYASAGDYEVTLEVQDGTCSNFVKQNITIYDEPVPDFNIPGGNLCTNQPYSFINSTPDNFDGLLSYDWQLDGMSIATTRDLKYQFTSGGTKELKLITTIPGCSVEVAKNLLNIKEGTLPQFSFDDNCTGETVQFTNNSVGTITDIAWDFGNGFTSTLENPALEFATDGTYDVTLTLTNSDGCVTNATTPITIHPLPSVSFSNELACENLGTQFTDLSSVTLDNLAAWEWQFEDGTPISNEQNPAHEFGTSGDFNVKLVTTTTFGCRDSIEQVVNVLEAPVADFSLDKICIDVPIQFTDESTPVEGESITDWSWSLGGTFSSQQNPTLVLSNALDYDFSLTVKSQNLCTSTITKTTTIPPKPTILFEIENDCANEIAIFSDVTDITGDNILQREWFLDNESLGNGITIDHQFSGSDDYNVTLEIETENGCSYSSAQTITVNPVPVAAFSTSFSFGAPPFIVDFTNKSQGASTYNWTFEESEFSTDLNPTYTFNNLGSFDVQLVVINDFNCSDSTTQRIEVLDPLLDIQLLNFSIVPSAESDMLSITVKNNGTIRLDSLDVVINLGGKLDVHEVIKVALNPEETITTQLELKVNNRKLEYICVSVNSFLTEIEEVNKEDNNKCVTFNANSLIFAPPYPNPTKDRINLEVISTSDTEISVEIISSKGTQSATWKAPISEGSNQLSLDLSNLQGGLYFLKLSIDGQLKTYRFVVNN